MEHWIFIERQAGPHMWVGPYATQLDAARALDLSLLIEGLCEKDCLDAFTTAEQPPAPGDTSHEIVIIDPTEPHHTGRTA